MSTFTPEQEAQIKALFKRVSEAARGDEILDGLIARRRNIGHTPLGRTTPVLAPEQEARIREIVAEAIGQFAAGANARIAAAAEATARAMADLAATVRANVRRDEMSVTEVAVAYREAAAAHHTPPEGCQHQPLASSDSPRGCARACPASAQDEARHG